MRVIGIDPGIATTGYGVVERRDGVLRALDAGVLRTTPGSSHGARLSAIARELRDLMRAHRPDVAVVESLFVNANVRTAMAVGQASGVALATAADLGIEVVTLTPTEVKLSVAGSGGASKRQVQAMVARLLHLPRPPSPTDAADACALALCHLNRAPLASAIAGARR